MGRHREYSYIIDNLYYGLFNPIELVASFISFNQLSEEIRMTPERAKELLPIIQAYAEGKTIQYRANINVGWRDAGGPRWDDDFEYRIKPEPKVIYVNEYENGDMAVCKTKARAEAEADSEFRENGILMDRVAVKYIEASD